MEDWLNGLHCIMYVYNRTYIFSRLILKETELPTDVVDIIIRNILRINKYPMGHLCKKLAIMTEWGDLQKGFCNNINCYNAFHKYKSCPIRMKPAFKINEPRFGYDAPINTF